MSHLYARLILMVAACLLAACSDSHLPVTVSTTASAEVGVVATSPINGASRISQSPVISVEFSESIDSRTIDETTFQVTAEGKTAGGDVYASSRFARFVVDEPLPFESRVEVTLTRDIRTASGMSLPEPYRFHFEVVSSRPSFRVVRTIPEPDESEVSVSTEILVRFNEEVDAASIGESTVSLRSEMGRVSGTTDVDRHSLSFRPNRSLEALSTFRLRLAGHLRSVGGDTLGDPFEIGFRTSGSLEVVELMPSDDEQVEDLDTQIVVELSYPVEPSSVSSESLVIEGERGEFLSGSIEVDDNRVVFTPTDPLEHSVDYYATLRKGIRSLEGHVLQEDELWQFATRPWRVPSIAYFSFAQNTHPNRVLGIVINEDGSLGNESVVAETGGHGAGELPGLLAVSKSGRFLFNSNSGTDDVASFKILESGTLEPVIGSPFFSGGSEPAALVASPDDLTLFVSCRDDRSISMLEIDKNGALRVRSVAQRFENPVEQLDVSPDGRYLLVSFKQSFRVMEILPSDRLVEVIDHFVGGLGTGGGRFTPDQEYFIGASWGDPGLAHVLDTTHWQPVPGEPFDLGAARETMHSGFSPGGKFLYLANQLSGDVSGLRLQQDGVLVPLDGFPIRTGEYYPNAISVSKKGFLYLSDYARSASAWRIGSYTIEPDGRLTLNSRRKLIPTHGGWGSGLIVVE